LGVGAKAKTMTNNLPILSVLGFRAFLFCPLIQFVILNTNPKSRWNGLEGSCRKLWIRHGPCGLRHVPDSEAMAIITYIA